MESENTINGAGKRKIQVYAAASYLFQQGRSFPQIVELLGKMEPDTKQLITITEKAQHETWDKLYQESRTLFEQGKTYDQVLAVLNEKEPDHEVCAWICGEWYQWKTRYMELMFESPGNIADGIKWVVISGIAIPVLFYMHALWLTKTIWIITFIAASIQWIAGIRQRQYASKIDRLFSSDFD